ncbi:MAG: heparinase II/III family protein, partial [Lentisphaeria bacterium]|nr:heparinase II/III family protein [Lentisphaeria bacterium]
MKMMCRIAGLFAAFSLSAAQWNFPADGAKVQSLPPERGQWRIPAEALPDPGTAGATVEAEIKISAEAKKERRRMVLAAHGTDTGTHAWVLSWVSDGNVAANNQELRFSIALPEKQYFRFSAPALVEADTVARFTVTLDGKKIRFYQDGNLLQENDCPVFLPRNPQVPVLIGGYPLRQKNMPFPGEILRFSVEPSVKVPPCTRKLQIPALYYRNYDCSYASAPAPAQHPFIRTEEAVRRAKDNVARFQWAAKLQQKVLKNAECVLDLTEKDLAYYISDLPGSDCSCPKCEQPSNIAWPYFDTNADTLVCAACKTVFPNEKFPEDKEFVLTMDNGRVLKMKYHEGKHIKLNEGNRYFLSGVLRQKRLSKTLHLCVDAAVAYLLTDDVKYAAAVRKILLRIAEVYPGYPARLRNTYFASPGNHPWAGKFYRWKLGDNQHILKITSAYDAIYHSGVLSDADKVAIENGIFREYKKLLTAMPPWSDLTNSMVYGYAGMIFAGRTLADPEMIRWVTEGPQGLNAFVATWFHRDGFWHENACSYQGMAIGTMNLLLMGLEGYSDPADYRKPDRYDNLNVAEKLPMIGKAFRSAAFATLPNGLLPPANDSVAASRYSSRFAKYARLYFDSPDSREIFRFFGGDGDADRTTDDLFEFDQTLLEELRPEPLPEFLTASRIFPGPRWMLLRSGFGKNGGAMLLDYGEKYLYHVHTPSLNFIYFDFGTELVTDIGYLSAQHKATVFNKSTVAHVTVMVDEQPHHAGSRRRT